MDVGGNLGACVDSCEPFSDTCPAGTECKLRFNAFTDGRLWFCDGNGTTARLGACNNSRDCLAGDVCAVFNDSSLRCETTCDDDNLCTLPGSRCRPLDLDPTVGRCEVLDTSCVGNVVWDTPEGGVTEAVVEIQAIDFGLGSVADVEVVACAADDLTCANPLASGTTNAAGTLQLTVPVGSDGFFGYFLGTKTGLVDVIGYPESPVVGDGGVVQLPMNPLEALEGAWDPVQTFDVARGTLAVIGHLCADEGGGFTLTTDGSDGQTVIGYETLASDGALIPGAPVAVGDLAGVANHPTGLTTVTLTMVGGAIFAQRPLLVRANTLTYTVMKPTP
jgi:hypothetical protein